MFKRRNKSPQEGESKVHKVSFNQKLPFGLSAAGLTFISATIDGAMLKFYTDFILFPAILFGIVQLLFAIINAINDPFLGYYSDRTTYIEGKGKRKRWLMSSLPLLAIGYFLMIFMSPDLPDQLIFIFLLIAFAFYDTGSAMNGINRGALQLTLTDDDNERASFTVVNLVFQTILGIFSYLIVLRFFVEEDNSFSLPVIVTVLAIVGIIGTGFLVYGARSIKEPSKLYHGVTTFPYIKKLLKYVVRSKTYIFHILIQFLMGAVTATVISFQLFYFDDVIGVGGNEVMIVSAIALPFTFFAYYLVQAVNKQLGPRKSLMIFIVINIMAFLGLFLTRNFLLSVICYVIINMGNAAFWILSSPIYGWVIDEYELKTGNRPLGTFNGINAIFMQPNKQIMLFLFTVILSITGYDGRTGVIQNESVKFGIQIGVGLIPAILFGIAFLFLLFFPLRGEKLANVKREINKLYDERLAE